jgi:glycosyltransferase involved in cell wall biosynthesis
MNPKISICMATYNGEKYLRKQLISILFQLSWYDEVVIVDDSSTDNTIEIIHSINDSRIRLYKMKQNSGHINAFERSIELALGEIIILSDQDDIWSPKKYSELISTFNNFPETVMVVHGLSLINSDGILVSEEWLRFKDEFPGRYIYLFGQLLKSSVFGSALAFRRNLVDLLLPFPRCVYAHDHWITIASTLRGKIKLDSGQLTSRRIHGDNITPREGLPVFLGIYNRVIFIWLIIIGLVRITKKYLINKK